MLWLRDLLPPEVIEVISPARIGGSCLSCRGKGACGKPKCSVLLKVQSLAKSSPKMDSTLVSGPSPPSVFVGRIGYPKVFVGPMVSLTDGEVEKMDLPETWLGFSLEDLVSFRCSLLLGKKRAEIGQLDQLQELQELSMSSKPVETEMVLTKPPKITMTLSEESQPFGPSAPLSSLRFSVPKLDHRLEKAYHDFDLGAADAVVQLYWSGVPVSSIQRSFSLGCFGVKKHRRLVPTRWSITAVDSIISQDLVERLKDFPPLNEYRVYKFEHLGNRFVVVFFPRPWSFEWMEAWYPGTTWNLDGENVEVMSDWEGYRGRKTYPQIGGCYYACRLSVAEALVRERRQAAVLAMREIHPGFILPLGVWLVRECIRETLRRKPERFENLDETLRSAFSYFSLPASAWIGRSWLLRELRQQTTLDDRFK